MLNRRQMNEVYVYRKEIESIERCIETYPCTSTEALDQHKKKLEEAIQNCEKEIATLPNSRLRTIFRMRYIECMTWQEIADELGGRNTVDSVKKLVYRQFDEREGKI